MKGSVAIVSTQATGSRTIVEPLGAHNDRQGGHRLECVNDRVEDETLQTHTKSTQNATLRAAPNFPGHLPLAQGLSLH